MTDGEFNLYMECRRQYGRVCRDIEQFKGERSELDNLVRIGSQEPQWSDYKWWERLLVWLKLRNRRKTIIPQERLYRYTERVKYLDRVIDRAEMARDKIYSKLNSYRPTDTELRFVDIIDRQDRLQAEFDRLNRIVKTMLK